MSFKKIFIAGAVCLCTASATFARSSADTDSLSVAVGTSFGHDIAVQLQRLRSLGVAVDVDVFAETLTKVLHGENAGMTNEEATAWLDNYIASTRPTDLPDTFTPESQDDFLDSVAALPGAVRYPDGLIMIVELEGEGAMPVLSDTVRLMYSGRLSDGREFDATTAPVEFGVDRVTPGFSEGLQLMRPGGRYRIVMPASLAYGVEGIPGVIPGNAALDFTVDLLAVKPANQ